MTNVFGDMDPENIRNQLSSEAGRMKFADIIGTALAELVNGVAEMVTSVLTGKSGSSSLTDPLNSFIESVKANLDYDAIGEALQHLIKAGATLLLEYEGMKAKFISATVTAASKGAGMPEWMSKLAGAASGAKSAPLGAIRNDYEQGKSTEKLLGILQKGGLNRLQSGRLLSGARDGKEERVSHFKDILQSSEEGRNSLAEMEEYLSKRAMKSDFENALHESGLFDGSPPYLRTMAYELLPALRKETADGNKQIVKEVKNINSAIRAMASTSPHRRST